MIMTQHFSIRGNWCRPDAGFFFKSGSSCCAFNNLCIFAKLLRNTSLFGKLIALFPCLRFFVCRENKKTLLIGFGGNLGSRIEKEKNNDSCGGVSTWPLADWRLGLCF